MFFQVITGNQNTYIAVMRELRPPIIARGIRLVPFSNHPRTVCMRFELHGCQWGGKREKKLKIDGHLIIYSNELAIWIYWSFSHEVTSHNDL